MLGRHMGSRDRDRVELESMDVRLTNGHVDLPRLVRGVDELCARHQVPPAIASSLNLALEEAVSNVVHHGYDDAAPHQIDVRVSVVEGMIRAEVVDDGRPFDPREATPPDLAAGIEERPIGGLGVWLIKRLMDEIEYQMVGGRNHLTLSKRWP